MRWEVFCKNGQWVTRPILGRRDYPTFRTKAEARNSAYRLQCATNVRWVPAWVVAELCGERMSSAT